MSSKSKINQGGVKPKDKPGNQNESTPITTRSNGTRTLGRTLLSNLVNSVSPFSTSEKTELVVKKDLNESTGMESSDTDDEGTSVDKLKSSSVQTDMIPIPSVSREVSDSYQLKLPPKVYELSDDEWPVREAIMFRCVSALINNVVKCIFYIQNFLYPYISDLSIIQL